LVYIVAYDIGKDSTRTKLSKYLESIGRRIQKSIFICDLGAKDFQTAKRTIVLLAKDESSDVVIISLCNGCQGKVRHLGARKESFEII